MEHIMELTPTRVARIYLDGYRPAILSEPGRKLTFAAINTGAGIKAIKLSNKDAAECPDLLDGMGLPYSLDKAQKIFRQAAKRGEVSARVKALLRGVK